MPFAPEWPAYSALVVAVATLLIAGLVLRARPRAAPNQFFAFFMVLIAGNFACQFVALGFPPASRASQLWTHAALLFLIWDPAVLVYFASVFPRRSFLVRNRFTRVGLTFVPLAFTAVFFAEAEPFLLPDTWQKRLLITYLAASYLYCLAILALADPGAPGLARTRQTQALMLGFGVALIPRFGLVADDLALHSAAYSPGRVAFRIAFAWLVFGALWFLSTWATRQDPTHRPRGLRVPWVFKITLIVLVLFSLLWLLGIGLAERSQTYRESELNLYYPFRWILFAGVVGYAIAKYQVFDIELRLKRFLREGSPVLLGLSAFALGYALLRVFPSGFLGDPRNAAASVAAAIGLLVTVALRGPASRLTERVLPRVRTDEAYVRARKLEVYAAQLEAAAAEGRLGHGRDPALEALRSKLGLTLDDHQALERLVRRAASQPARLEDRIASGEPLFGRYRVLRRLDSGGFADVFVAEDLERGARVVIKRLHPGFSQDERVLRSFLREAEVAGRVRHANVVPVHEVLRELGDAYLVLDYVEGGSLADAMKRTGRWPVDEATRLVTDLLAGLEAVHAQGVFHRDLKPANVLLAPDGRALLTDFGVAHVPSLEETLSGGGVGAGVPGTVSYMAPEQADGRPVDGRADIWAAGLILYELVTGERLFPADGLGEFELRRRIARGVPRSRLERVPASLRPVLAKALATRPEDRYQTPAEMQRALAARSPPAAT